jgi:hypothetical protein
MAAILQCTIPTSFDLFGSSLCSRGRPLLRQRQPLELKVAGALCRQLRRKPARREKQRIAHLICLNLVSMLRHRAKR